MVGLAGFFVDKVTFFAYDQVALSITPNAPSVWQATVDASVSEQHDFKVLVPKHPVFKGIPVSDNARPEPDEFSCTVLFSNAATRIDQAVLKTIAFAKGDTAETTRQMFEDLAKGGALWTINTSLKIYKNMMLSSGGVPRSAQTGNQVTFNLHFTEVRSASVGLLDTKIRKPAVKAKAKVVTKGPQVAAQASSPLRKSAAANLLDMTLKRSPAPR